MASVLITGSSSGIGFETALAFGRAGHRVTATMRNPAARPALAQIAAAERLPMTVVAMDVDADASVREAIAKHAGPIDILVNNAGIERTGSVEELPLDAFRAVMETNYLGPSAASKPCCRPCGSGAGRLHHQRGVDRRASRLIAVCAVCGLEVCLGGAQRMPGPRGQTVQCAGGNYRAGHHRYVDGETPGGC